MALLYPQRRSPKSIGAPLGIAYMRSLWQATSVVAPVIVCTAGVWSSTISFVACDDFRVTIDGPAADQVKISATIELTE